MPHLLKTAVSKLDVDTLRTRASVKGPLNAVPCQASSVVLMSNIISDILVPPLVN